MTLSSKRTTHLLRNILSIHHVTPNVNRKANNGNLTINRFPTIISCSNRLQDIVIQHSQLNSFRVLLTIRIVTSRALGRMASSLTTARFININKGRQTLQLNIISKGSNFSQICNHTKVKLAATNNRKGRRRAYYYRNNRAFSQRW